VRWFPIAVPFLVACGDDPRGVEPKHGGHDETVASVNGQPADAYYDQFAWETTGTFLVGAAGFPTQPDGRNLLLIHLYLMEDGTFVLFYEEGEGEVDLLGWSISTDVASRRREEGTWTTDGAELDVGGLLRCDGLTFDGEEQLSCRLEAEIVTADAVGVLPTLGIDRFGDSSPSDSDWRDYR
jgi:hypothetical protein